MPVQGLLVTLDDDPEKTASALTLLGECREIELGEQKEKWLPLVLETMTETDNRRLYRWIESLEGVYFVDTVFSSVEGPEEGIANLTR